MYVFIMLLGRKINTINSVYPIIPLSFTNPYDHIDISVTFLLWVIFPSSGKSEFASGQGIYKSS